MFNSAVEREIGNDYREWIGKRTEKRIEETYNLEKIYNLEGDRIFIDAPTGSGKTTFIFEVLLQHYSKCDKKILYLVNRRILKNQIKEGVADLSHSLKVAIRVELYQEIEKRIAAASDWHDGVDLSQAYEDSLLKELSEYDCVVCDEAHYFLTDSNYNTNTVFSFRWIQNVFRNKPCIFMSATIRELQSYIETDELYESGRALTTNYKIPKYDAKKRQLRVMEMPRGQSPYMEELHKIMTYRVAKDYSYIRPDSIRIISDRKELIDIVAEGSRKWLIFVDSINYGRALRNSVIKKLRELKNKDSSENIDNKVILISSGYKRDQDSTDEVDRIIRTQTSSAKVLIVTSVLDNGVNIKDIDVRNVVLFADTETEFIQMLGRKRKDAQQFKLYIYGYDRNHFSKRKSQLMKQKEIADNYLCDVEEEIKKLDLKKPTESWEEVENIRRLYEREEACIGTQHRKMMQKIFDNYIKFEDVRRTFTIYAGKLYLNMLSFQNIENLNCYYRDMISKFEEEGDDAFAREQLSWIGKTGKVADEIIIRSKKMREEEARTRVLKALNKIAGKKKLKTEFIEIVDNIIEDLRVLVAQPVDFPDENTRTNKQFECWQKIKREFSKKGKPISKQSMDFLYTYCRVPFQVVTDREGGYTVRQIGSNSSNEE